MAASYFQLVLDTLAPSGVTLVINNGATYTTSEQVTLKIGCSDANTTGYSMLIYGIDGAETEAKATWETFATSKTVTLPTGDGRKTISIKIRDDVYNTSAAVSASITLSTAVPTVTISGPDVSKISKTAPKNVSSFSFTADVAFTEFKVKVVPSVSSLHDAGTTIGTTGGSTNMSGTGSYKADTAINCKIYGADLETASSGDGNKIIKVFVKNEAGTWSEA